MLWLSNKGLTYKCIHEVEALEHEQLGAQESWIYSLEVKFHVVPGKSAREP